MDLLNLRDQGACLLPVGCAQEEQLPVYQGLCPVDDFIQSRNTKAGGTSGNPFPIQLSQFPNERKTCYKQRILGQRPPALARLYLASQCNRTGQPGLAPSPHMGGCQAQAPPWLVICRQGSPMTLWLARLPPLFVGQLYQLGGWCVQSQVLPLFG